RHAAVSAVAGPDKHLCFIEKFHGSSVTQGHCSGNTLNAWHRVNCRSLVMLPEPHRTLTGHRTPI
ncbi:MAG: hypothetical protein NTZ72_01990, partial [Afipia sp.]|nr:hypothetical protein [Afipia sp.]